MYTKTTKEIIDTLRNWGKTAEADEHKIENRDDIVKRTIFDLTYNFNGVKKYDIFALSHESPEFYFYETLVNNQQLVSLNNIIEVQDIQYIRYNKRKGWLSLFLSCSNVGEKQITFRASKSHRDEFNKTLVQA